MPYSSSYRRRFYIEPAEGARAWVRAASGAFGCAGKIGSPRTGFLCSLSGKARRRRRSVVAPMCAAMYSLGAHFESTLFTSVCLGTDNDRAPREVARRVPMKLPDHVSRNRRCGILGNDQGGTDGRRVEEQALQRRPPLRPDSHCPNPVSVSGGPREGRPILLCGEIAQPLFGFWLSSKPPPRRMRLGCAPGARSSTAQLSTEQLSHVPRPRPIRPLICPYTCLA